MMLTDRDARSSARNPFGVPAHAANPQVTGQASRTISRLTAALEAFAETLASRQVSTEARAEGLCEGRSWCGPMRALAAGERQMIFRPSADSMSHTARRPVLFAWSSVGFSSTSSMPRSLPVSAAVSQIR